MTDNLEHARLFQERVSSYIKMGLLNEENDLKENWRTFSYILSTVPITDLYHITSSQNVQSIFEHGGLISRVEQDHTGTHAYYYVTPRSDRETRAQYVHLSFCPNTSVLTALEQQKEQAVLLTIDPIAAILKGTSFLYYDGDAPSKQQPSGDETTESLLKIDFDAEFLSLSLFLREQERLFELDSSQTEDRNAIILVPNRVPSFLIKDIKLI